MDSFDNGNGPTVAMNSHVRRRPPPYGTSEDDALLHSYDEEGYPVLKSYIGRRRVTSSLCHRPWYRQPQQLILLGIVAWAGSVMYLSSLAHSVLRTHQDISHSNMMGSSMANYDENYKRWLESQGVSPSTKYGAAANTNSDSSSNEDFQKWLSTQNKYGASGSSSVRSDLGDAYQDWLQYLKYGSSNTNDGASIKYGASDSSTTNNNEDFQKWLANQNKYGTADPSTSEDFQKWPANQNKYGASSNDLGDAYQDWLQSLKYGSSDSSTNQDFQKWLAEQNKYGSGEQVTNEDFKKWLANQNKYGTSNSDLGDAYQDWLQSLKYGASSINGGKSSNINVRFGNSDPSYQEWLEYQNQNIEVKYNANGMFGKEQKSLNDLPKKQLSSIAASSSTVSTIDWPLQGISQSSCTNVNGCSHSNNITVLIVYGPEYHSHISEMAWNVAIGVHTAFQSHIRHHPNSQTHGHIVFGHTSNITFLDVIDADAIIIGSPVYNGNVHPDVQNWINYWHIGADLSNKFGGAFVTAGGINAGADGSIMSILRSMMVFQMMIVGGDSWTSPFGAAATMYEDPFGETVRSNYFDSSCYFTEDDGRKGDHLVHPYFLRKAYGLGERIANVTVAWKNSSYVRWD